MTGDGELEPRVVKFGDHRPHVVSDPHHLVLDVINLALLGVDLSLALVDLVLEVGLGLFLLLSAHGVNLGVSLELLFNVAVLLLNQINFTVEHVNVVEERNVLFLGLDERSDDLIDGSDTSALLDLLEGVLNDLNVSGVHVHEILLLLVVVDNLIQADLEQDSWVSEVSHRVSALFGAHVLGARFLSLVLVLLLQLLLKIKDAMLEVEFVHVVLSLKGQNLILSLLRESVASLGEVVELLNALDDATDLLVQATVNLVLNGLLLAGGIDLLLELLVLALKLVECVELLVQLVLTQLDLVAVPLDHDLLNLILLDMLIDSVLLADGEGGELIESVSPGAHIVAFQGDTESLTDLRVFDREYILGFFLFELLLGSLNLTCKDHQAPKFNGYRFRTLSISLGKCTYFFSCSNFLVKLSASRYRRWASLSYMAVWPMREP